MEIAGELATVNVRAQRIGCSGAGRLRKAYAIGYLRLLATERSDDVIVRPLLTVRLFEYRNRYGSMPC